MPDVCDQDTIEVSPALRNILQRHQDRDYMLSWFAGMIRTYVNRDLIKQKIRERFLRGMERNIERLGPEYGSGYENAANRYKQGAIEFLNDFDALSFSDIDAIRQILPQETVARIITTINGKQIIFTED